MIKKWFLEKNFSSSERYAIETGELQRIKETEKAIQFKCLSKYGDIVFWCPKSCLEGCGEKKKATTEEVENIKKTGKTIMSNTGRRFIMA